MADTPSTVGSPLEQGQPLIQAQFSTPEQKRDKNFGKTLITSIYREQSSGNVSFYGGRKTRLSELSDWAAGRNTIKEFLDLMKVDGTQAYTGVDPTPNRQGPQFVETLVNAMAKNEEYPCVSAVDQKSKDEKEQRKQEALFRMNAGEHINQMQEHSGLMLEPPNAYVPEDELSAEVYFQLEDRIPVEIELEQGLEQVMLDNEYPSLKRRIIRDAIVVNSLCTKIEKRPNGFIGIRKPVPGSLIYNFFLSDSGKMELTYIGEVYSLKVRELRRLYGSSMSEKELFDLCKTATRTNAAIGGTSYSWRESYKYDNNRPYDDYAVTVFDCEIKLFDTDYYVSKTDAYGKENIHAKKAIPQPTSDRAKIITKEKYTVYRGVWAIDADKMIYWGLPDVVIKPYADISESLFSYTLVIPGNDGLYVPSLFERALSPLKKLSLIDFKIKQILANLCPPGYTIDVESIRDIEVNGKILTWEQVISIRNQTGVVLWSSRSLNPSEQNPRPPIEGINNAESTAQLQELINQKADAQQEIRSVLGVPLYRDGSDLPPRMGNGVVENQTANSNNVTDFITAGFHQCMQETLNKVCIMKWDELALVKGKTEFLGKEFRTTVEMRATDYEKQLIESQIATWSKTIDGNGNPLLGPKDVFKIRQIKNFKMQDLYLTNMVEQNRKNAMQQSAALQAQNSQVQSQAAQQAAQQAAFMEDAKQKHEAAVKDAENRAKKEQILIQGLLSIVQAGTLPPMMMPLLQEVMTNIALPLAVENEEIRQQVAQQMQAAQMMQQQQAAMPQGQAPQQQEAPETQSENQPPEITDPQQQAA